VVDLPTLDLLGSYRDAVESTEPLPFGVWGRVVEPGTVRVGDEVVPLDG
jgi:MOSC domain-containing protein YiiM